MAVGGGEFEAELLVWKSKKARRQGAFDLFPGALRPIFHPS